MTKLTGPQNATAGFLVSQKALPPIALCGRYFSAHVEERLVKVQVTGAGSAQLTVSWAVGVLTDGGWEVLGAWPGTAAGPAFWRGVWADLDDRGVRKVSWVCAADGDARVLCPTAKVLPPFRLILGRGSVPAASRVADISVEARHAVREASSVRRARMGLEQLLLTVGPAGPAVLAPDWPEVLEQFEAFYALPPKLRAVVRTGDEVVERLNRILSRAVVRHDPFASADAATAFVGSTLARAEQRLTFSELTKLAPPPRHGVGFCRGDAGLLISSGHPS